MVPLTDAQQRVLDFVLGFLQDQGYPPSAREICARLGFRSTRTALDHLDGLEKKGYLHRAPATPRGIEVAAALRPERERGLPLVGRVAAGAPLLAEENIEDEVRLGEWFGGERTFLLRVKGDSMARAGILDGDLVVVRETPQVENGEIAVCLLGDDATVKRFFDEGGSFRLQPENEAYEPIYVQRGAPSFRIGGKVVGVVRRF